MTVRESYSRALEEGALVLTEPGVRPPFCRWETTKTTAALSFCQDVPREFLVRFSTACGPRITHGKWKETKQQPSLLPGPAVPGCSLVSFPFLWAILCPQAVVLRKIAQLDGQRAFVVTPCCFEVNMNSLVFGINSVLFTKWYQLTSSSPDSVIKANGVSPSSNTQSLKQYRLLSIPH